MNTIQEALDDFRAGKFVIVVDDEDRENEGDFITAAETITPEKVNFMLQHGRGVLCAPVTEERCAELELVHQVQQNTSMLGTPFTVTVDLLDGCTTGVSAHDRAATIRALADPKRKPQDFGRPGHINPLYAKTRGVLERAGHTEAAIDLCRLSGLYPAAALIEIMNTDGTMARLPELEKVAKEYDLKLISIKDLIAYRMTQRDIEGADGLQDPIPADAMVTRGETVFLPTAYGEFELTPFRQLSNGLEHIALVKGTWEKDEPILCRVHSSCATGDIFGSKRCECGEQLHRAMQMVQEAGKGIIVYMNQEGRGIGLMNKISAYKLQEQGMDTVEANVHLGFDPDLRDYGVGAEILREMGAYKLRLMTNNPVKRVGLESYGIEIVENIPIEIAPNPYNERYMRTKKEKMHHNLHLV
ncbi:MAG: 3,4-dihydroxy-2-butanone-4-phosphate synthase [Paludibacteraceae bacterium]|nr:3,4-dihydroxy-2-butanone-4-phosphate synthase [Paludibacteraceae bacterium]MBR4459910.1 3,4-dihydroxy-2-butanone-4-phosphate synthase [Paludibacteraceae bacterium]MBR4548126.1 3,4-dihydroxy-2-butanone-4-phosphate synthase [Paludibacteraceae bacterium]MBR6146202.1 3,4-dihydroxy-2-butanone-4-phosphate synthase [Paludibacteraceae bacterium]